MAQIKGIEIQTPNPEAGAPSPPSLLRSRRGEVVQAGRQLDTQVESSGKCSERVSPQGGAG